MMGPVEQWVRSMRAQVAAARKAGADELDLAIVVPAGYLALVQGAPVIELNGKVVCLVSILTGEAMAEMAWGETGRPPPLNDRPLGLFQMLGP